MWKPELKDKVKPRVYYLGLPKKFIAGTVYDPKDEEVIIGATCTLKPANGKAQTIETDGYGDFWFEDLADGTYDLEIKSGKKVKTFTGLDTARRHQPGRHSAKLERSDRSGLRVQACMETAAKVGRTLLGLARCRVGSFSSSAREASGPWW